METGLLCAGACWAGVVMPPANGLGKLVERLVFFLGVLLLVAPVEAEPAVIVVGGAIALRLLAGEGACYYCTKVPCGEVAMGVESFKFSVVSFKFSEKAKRKAKD